jgi:hypothetical protein
VGEAEAAMALIPISNKILLRKQELAVSKELESIKTLGVSFRILSIISSQHNQQNALRYFINI